MKAIDTSKAFVVEESATCSPNSMIIMLFGRMYITEGFSKNHGYYTWLDGLAAFVKEGDTIESLSKTIWNKYGTTHLEAILHAYDSERPICEWPNYMIEEVAIAAIKNSRSDS